MPGFTIFIAFKPPLDLAKSRWDHIAKFGIFESLARVANDAQEVLDAAIIAEAPRRSGAYAATIKSRKTVGNSSVSLTWTAADPLSTWILKGTAPHVITPRQAGGVLVFEAGGGTVFARKVNHPGTAANDYPARAWSNAAASIEAIFGAAGRDIIATMTKAT